MSRTQNAIRNTKWGLAQRIVSIFLPFVVRTILIYTLSAEYAGISGLFSSILQILSLTELGFSNAIVYSMYQPVATGDKGKICALLNVYKKAYRIVGLSVLGLGLLLLPFLRFFIKGDVPSDVNLYLLYLVYLLNTSISYFLFAYETALFSAHQREDIISRNTLIFKVVLHALQAAALLLLRSYYVFVFVIPVSTIFLNLLNHAVVKKQFPEYVAEGTISAEEKAELKKNLIGLTIWKIGGATRNTLDSVVISMFLGLTVVAIYHNYFLILSGVITMIGVILSSIVAGVGNKMVTDSPEANYADFEKFHFFYMWLSGWCCVCMMCLFQPFMRLWMGEGMLFSNGIVFLFCVYFMQLKRGDINSVYYQAAGLWWIGRYRSIAEAFINLILNFVLGRFWGVTGILLATVITCSCMFYYGARFVFIAYFKNKRQLNYFADTAIYVALPLATGVLLRLFLDWLLAGFADQIPVLLISFAFCLVVPNLVFLVFYALTGKKRFLKEIPGMVRSLAGKEKGEFL